jgi:FkbM family methyltransferase
MDLKKLIQDYKIEVKGVIQLGSHYFEEESLFESLGAKNLVLVEPLPHCCDVIRSKIADKPILLFQVAVGNENSTKTMYVDRVNESQSSSLLKPDKHLQQYPQITFPDKIDVKCKKLDSLQFDKSDYNLIYADLQGFEGEAFKGAIETLKNIDAVFTEVNRESLYEGCILIEDLDKLLKKQGFERTDVDWVGGSWGDALYIKKDILENKKKYITTKSETRTIGVDPEAEYLKTYPDVAMAIMRGSFKSGKDHYDRYGRAEDGNGVAEKLFQ